MRGPSQVAPFRKKNTASMGDFLYKEAAPVVRSAPYTSMLREHRKRIVLIEDHLVVRQGLERLLNATDEFVVCEEAGDAVEGMKMVREMRPDGVVVDVSLPGCDGIELTKQLLSEFPGLVVVVLSMHEEPEYVERARAAGAMAYVVKSNAIDALQIALHKAFGGRKTFGDEPGSVS